MLRRLSPYLLGLLALVALAVGVLELGWVGGGGDNEESSASPSREGDETPIAPPDCKGKCAWSVQSLASPGGGRDTSFKDVSCPSPTSCIAVGNDRYPNFYVRKSFVVLAGKRRWKTIDTFEGEIRAISCPQTSWCVVVGINPPSIWKLERRKSSTGGAGWQVEAVSPPVPQGSRELRPMDVSCTSEAFCTAVGTYWDGGYKNYVARWDGGSWALQAAPEPKSGVAGATYGMLGVSCASPTFCVTVGEFAYKPTIQHWDGERWKILAAPSPADSPKVRLEGISCTSSSACMAVGSVEDESERTKPYFEHWNGSDWSFDMPALGKEGDGALRSVSCLSASSCIAVGGVSHPFPTPKAEETVAMAWNGTEWTLQPSPNPRAFNSFEGVSCFSPAACTAVGRAAVRWEGGAGTKTLVGRFG